MVEAAAVLKKLVLAVSAASVGGKSCVEREKRKEDAICKWNFKWPGHNSSAGKEVCALRRWKSRGRLRVVAEEFFPLLPGGQSEVRAECGGGNKTFLVGGGLRS